MHHKIAIFICFVLQVTCLKAQIGGLNSFKFLDLPNSARVTALGGQLISVRDKDINNAFQNPALIDSVMHNNFALSGVSYVADIKYGDVAYGYNFKKLGTFVAGMHYINYGEFQTTDANSDVTGTFKAAEYALNIAWGRTIRTLTDYGFSSKLDSMFSYGFNVKNIYSVLEQYSSYGLAADFGINYYWKKEQFSVSLVVRNMGKQIKTFIPDNPEPLPFEIMAAVSKKLEKAPLRLTLTARHLEQMDISYVDPNKAVTDPFTNVTTPQQISKADKVLRHFIGAAEILLTDNFNIRFAYNHQRRQELTVDTRQSLFVGTSIGLGLRIKKFNISYGQAFYHLAGSMVQFSISTNLSDFIKKQ